ncbi:MAG: DUF423 domain-containing protein [Motiliproteus sp.]
MMNNGAVDTASGALSQGRWILVVAALLGALGLTLSAMSAHAFGPLIDSAGLLRLEKANRYLVHYSLVLLVVGLLYQFLHWAGLVAVALLFSAGVGIFSGSLYILCFFEMPWASRLVPVGGMALLTGWLVLAWAVWRQDQQRC